ncbi:protein phosphatase 2C domain-containing protein [Streptomyces candidus]|uniref:protein phosphatase 2C domain-containing protein n=1 Tax=Streptomyces candidus TaxID=67283 RepID=UPI001E33E79C|nr:protein phosphatase 2C domain-containing protein [Streptomyces candidus]
MGFSTPSGRSEPDVSSSATWGPPPSPPGPPGAPGSPAAGGGRRAGRLWDEPTEGRGRAPLPEPRTNAPVPDPGTAGTDDDPRTTAAEKAEPPVPQTASGPATRPPAAPPPATAPPAGPFSGSAPPAGPPPPPAPAAPDPRTSPVPEGRSLRDLPPLPTSYPAWEPPGEPSEPPATRAAGRPTTPDRPSVTHIGDGPPTYEAEPTALPVADPQDLGSLVADTVLDGAQYGTYTLRAASVRGDSARYRGELRRDALLTARFGNGPGALVLVAVASGARAAEGAHLAAADACRWIAGSVGRSQARLAEDIRAGRRGDLKSGLHRLTDRTFGKLRARAAELGLEPEEHTADLRCLLLPADPDCRTRVFFGVGGGGLLRLRDGRWQDIEPPEPRPDALVGAPVVGFGSAPAPAPVDETPLHGTPEVTGQGDRLTMDLGITTPPGPHVDTVPPTSPFRFRASVARSGDTLLLCSAGLAEPLRGENAFADELAERWARKDPPGLAAYLADVTLRVKGYADDRTAVAAWEA